MLVSIVIPSVGDVEGVAAVLTSLMAAAPGPDVEVIVADNGPVARLESFVGSIVRRAPWTIRYLAVPASGLHNARHRGVDAARGEIVAFIDDDVRVGRSWLEAISAAMSSPECVLVGGPSLPAFPDGRPRWADDLWRPVDGGGRSCGHLSLADLGDRPRRIDPTLVWGLNFTIRRTVLERLRGFGPDAFPWPLRRYRGDGEVAVTSALREEGTHADYRPGARVEHVIRGSRLTPRAFERRGHLQGISLSYAEARRSLATDLQRADAAPLRAFAHGLLLDVVAWRRARPGARVPLGNRFADRRGRLAGYRYHRRCLDSTPRLREWVGLPDYWHATVPEP